MRGTISTRLACIVAGVIALAMLGHDRASAEERGDWNDREQRRPVYQRRAFDWMDKRGHGHKHGRHQAPHFFEPSVSSGWFQRPYPYHLDYYKMRYGGSYAPYFGNLYGPPQVVTAPPYYGPYYGGYDYAQPPVYGQNGAYPGGPNGVIYESPVEQAAPADKSATPQNGDDLPSP